MSVPSPSSRQLVGRLSLTNGYTAKIDPEDPKRRRKAALVWYGADQQATLMNLEGQVLCVHVDADGFVASVQLLDDQ